MTLRKTIRQSQTAKEFYSQVFKPSYESLQNAARRTPLIIMLWGPRQRTRAWSIKRVEIRDRLQNLGHTVFFSEQLGVPATALTRKAVEYLQSETADLIIAMQSTYDSVGAVQHFVEYRVVDSKMLLFIDEAAPDRHLYERALADLKHLYNNVETYRSPEDIAGDNLVKKVVDKVSLMQIVKYRAIQRARHWGLRLEDSPDTPQESIAPLRPFRYNLLELYREHRAEIDVLSDSLPLFFLSYVQQTGRIPLDRLSKDIGLAEDSLLQVIAPLLRGEMMTRADGMLATTAFGKRTLEQLGLCLPAAPISVSRPAAPAPILLTRKRFAALSTGAGLALAAITLLFVSLLYGTSLIQNQQPLEITPARVALTATPTRIPAPTFAPTPPPVP
jgi:hypothetical protein